MGKNLYEGQPDARQSDKVSEKVSRFRPTYRALTENEKVLHDQIKAKAVELEQLFDQVGTGRYASLAMTNLETAVMWIVKELTSTRTAAPEKANDDGEEKGLQDLAGTAGADVQKIDAADPGAIAKNRVRINGGDWLDAESPEGEAALEQAGKLLEEAAAKGESATISINDGPELRLGSAEACEAIANLKTPTKEAENG